MEFLIFLLILLAIGLLIKTLTTATEAKRQADLLTERLERLERVWRSFPNLSPSERPVPSAPPQPIRPVSEPALEVQPVAEGPPSPGKVTPSRPQAPPPLPPLKNESEEPAAPPQESFPNKFLASVNWEQFMGVKLFAWLGGLALFLAVGFFIKYSFDRDLIPPELRVALGFAAGLALLIGGVIMRRKDYQVTSQTLCGTGIVILYAVTFACRAIYHFPLFGTGTTFFIMVLITAVAFTLAAGLNAMVVAILGLAGGFITPVLLSSGQDHAVGLFSYIALLDLGLLAVACVRRWNFLGLLAAIGTVLMQAGWILSYYAAGKIMTVTVVHLGFDVLFLAACIWFGHRKQGNAWLDWATAGLIFFTLLTTLFLIVSAGPKPIHTHILCILFGADLCLLTLSAFRPRLHVLEAVAGVIVFGLLSIWQMAHLNMNFLTLAMGATLGFALLHAGFPMLAAKWIHRARRSSWWAHLIPAAALLLAALPLLQAKEASFLLWPVMFMLDLLAFGLAIITGSMLALLLVIGLTVFNAAVWISRMPRDLSTLPESLVMIGGFAILLAAASLTAMALTRSKLRWPGLAGCLALPESLRFGKDIDRNLPALSAGLPFLLVLMMVLQLPLQNPAPVFGLALVLVGLLLGLTHYCKMPWLPLVALVGTALVQLAWQAKGVLWMAPAANLMWHVAFYSTFLLFPFFCWSRDRTETQPWIASALAGPLHFLLVYFLSKKVWAQSWIQEWMGVIPAAFAFLTGLAFLAILRWDIYRSDSNPKPRHEVLAWFGGVGLFFVTVIFPIQFERQWITVSWALEGAALLWLFRKIPHRGLQWVGLGLLQAAFIRLALNPAVLSYHPRSETSLLNWYIYAYGVAAGCCFAATQLAAPPRHILKDRDIRPWLYTMGTILLFLLVNIEIADFFTETGARVLTFKFTGNFARDMSYSIAWALFAFILLVIGIAKQLSAVRYAGLGLLGITLLKLFFHDLANLGQLYRVGALVAVAIIAILASFLYQKYLAIDK